MNRYRATTVAVLAAGLLATAASGPAWADDPGRRPLTAAQVTAMALTAMPCQSSGPSDRDRELAPAFTAQLNNSGRLGGRVDAYQVSCARAIVTAVRARELNERAAVIAVTTAITETTLHNWDGGDRDSVGLFQQRPSQGWGDPADLIKPAYATNRFLSAMLNKYPDNAWMSGDIGAICQRVQVSAYPDAYARDVHNATVIARGLWADQPERRTTPGDFDGDGRVEIGVYRTGNGQWHVKNIRTGEQVLASSSYGGDASDIPVTGDFDGDGRSEIGVYRKGNGQWHVKNIRTGEQILASSQYGGDPSDIPVVADFTGDGRAEIGVYRKGNGQWHIKNIRTGEQVLAQHQYGGDPSDIPVVADFTGDGRAEIGVYRKGNGQWHVKNIWTGEQVLASSQYGGDPSDIPVYADYTGDGRAEIGVYRRGNGHWHVKNIRTGEQILASSQYGGDPSDVPIVP